MAVTEWNPVLLATNPEDAYNMFADKIRYNYNLAFPNVELKRNKKIRKPWIDRSILKRIKEKNKLFASFIKTRNHDVFTQFKKVRNKLNSDIKNARNAYFENKFAAIYNDPRKIWNSINNLMAKGERRVISEIIIDGEQCTGSLLADKFNNHFLQSGAATVTHTASPSKKHCIPSSTAGSIFLFPVTESEILSLIKKLNNSRACGIDEFKIQPIKAVAQYICQPLSHICNLILNSGDFPDVLKIAKVSVIFKSGDPNDMNNYRPISVLPIFSKVIEQVINTRILSFCKTNHIIAEQQYGFQKQKSTEMAILNIKDKIIDNIEQKLFTIGVFLDFKKAFDSIKHDILFQKLETYGIRGTCLSLIKSYLHNRLQYTEISHARSNFGQIKYGVPQGSILGPLLFLLYINDIVNLPFTPDIILYADDTNVFFSGRDLALLERQTNLWLENLSIWLNTNKLNLNTRKTKYMIFRAYNKRLGQQVLLNFRGECIEQVTSHKFLGIVFNENLSWSPHIDKLRTDISRCIGIIYKMKYLLPAWLKRQLYYSLVHSRLNYCLLVWGSTGKTNIENLYRLQKKVLRIIENAPYFSHSSPLFKKHRVLTIMNILNKKLSLTIYHQIKTDSNDFYRKYTSRTHEYGFRQVIYTKPKTRTNYGHQKLSYQIPNILNSHPAILTMAQDAKSEQGFKRKLDMYLLELQ